MRKTFSKIAICVGTTALLAGCPANQPTATPTAPPPVSTPEATPETSVTPEVTATPGVTGTPSATSTPSVSTTPGAPISVDLKPLEGKETAAPTITKKTTVEFRTTDGEVVIEVYPEAAPNAAQRFIELVESGYYDDTAVSRVVPDFVAQFGVNWRAPHKAWKEKNFNDDPTYFQFEPGTLAFAKAGPNTNSTQVFINYGTNNRLASPDLNFSVFAKVVKGMNVVEKFAQVGDPSGGLDQQRLWEDGAAYIESLDQKPTMIEKATVVK